MIDLSHITSLGQPGYAFVYWSKIVANKTFLPRSVSARFFGMQSDSTLMLLYVPEKHSVINFRNQDFKPINSCPLPSISTLVEGISRKQQAEKASVTQVRAGEDHNFEDHLVKAFTTITNNFPIVWVSNETVYDPSVPSSFKMHAPILAAAKQLTGEWKRWISAKLGNMFLANWEWSL